MRETVEREPDGRSVSYSWHLSLNFAAEGLCAVSVKATCAAGLEARMGALCRLGPLDALGKQEKAVSW